ncbi:MAG: 7-cyano-7-deazaguanine synthase [Conexivisphaerales archaeon]
MAKLCVAVVSGGPDSIGYAAVWKSRGFDIYPVSFNYGQKGKKEIEVVERLSKKIGFKQPVFINVSSLKELWKSTQLTDDNVQVRETYAPDVVVPLRNGVFLMIAAAYADTLSADVLIYGAHLNDASRRPDREEPLYPDCTPAFAESLEDAINKGRQGSKKIILQSPAREGLTKSELLKRSYELLGEILYETWSCYLSADVHCGRCESCNNRKRAFREAGIEDKTKYMY